MCYTSVIGFWFFVGILVTCWLYTLLKTESWGVAGGVGLLITLIFSPGGIISGTIVFMWMIGLAMAFAGAVIDVFFFK